MKFFLTFLFSFFCLSSFANVGVGEIDSVKNLLANLGATPDTSVINKLNKLAEDYFRINPDSSYYYGNKSIQLSKQINYSAGIASGLLQVGHVKYFKGRSEEAKLDFDTAISIYKKLKNKKGLAACYVLYGRMYNLLANYTLALYYLNLAQQINIQINNQLGLTDTYKNIGIVYYSEGIIPKALDFYYKGLFIALKNHYKALSSEIYNDLGVILQSTEVYPNALEYFNKAIKISLQINDQLVIGTVNENIGEILLAEGKYTDAIIHLKTALITARKQDDKDGLGSIYTDLGLCYGHLNNIKVAKSYLDTSLQIAADYKFVNNQANAVIGLATVYNLQKDYASAYKYAIQGHIYAVKLGDLSVRAKSAMQLNQTLAGLGNFTQAYKYLLEYVDLKNQLKSDESIQKLTSYNFELNFAAKEHQEQQQQQEKDLLYTQRLHSQRLLNTIFIIIIIGMIGTLVVYYNQKRKQQKINLMLEEKNDEVLSQKENIDEQAHKLNELNVLKDRLISVLAHDLRAPLSTLRGLFGLLQDDTITHQELVEMIPSVLKKLEYTSDFLDTLLFWINSQMENFESSVKSFSIKDIVEYEMENYQEQATLKGITLIDNVPDSTMASADPNSIRIVIRNLITNAIKFSGEKDTIEVVASTNNEMIEIKVKDTGTGIPPDKLKKLFKSKVDSSTGTHQESGTGMGLLFCKDLVEKCNGKIWVTSQQDVGTEFSFTVPAYIA
ncbi:tetratricopeptide repeat-containing sensor histidine kinase [Mucilaginibacter sp. L196]|uniref:tetratricopeptide repeat-containing sensor histidine kinase n=1 Tax=Mucilaginibacter sp. L196 TaxID=1641870 RepID=UPI00131E0FB8|nr:tetratricopeptide repeat-containing sensor histidine kinase [Mucilaginibacter sp. L196]